MACTVPSGYSGTQTAVVGTPATLKTITTPGSYTAYIDCTAMASGDTVVLTVKMSEVPSIGPTFVTAGSATVSGAQTNQPVLPLSFSLPFQGELIFEQTAGTARSFPWVICRVD